MKGKITRRLSTEHALADYKKHHSFLSDFQVEKFSYMFKAFFDLDGNGLIEDADVKALAVKIREYCGWAENDERYHGVLDIMWTFLDCLKEQVAAEKNSDAKTDIIPTWKEAMEPTEEKVNSITLDQWLNMWGRLCYGSAGLKDFPCWVQLLPSIFFTIIDTDKDGILSFEEYKRFYREFIGIPENRLDKIAKNGYRAMTADGVYDLYAKNFDFCFANFLLGRSIYGPGKYIFGVFDNRDIDEHYKVDYTQDEE